MGGSGAGCVVSAPPNHGADILVAFVLLRLVVGAVDRLAFWRESILKRGYGEIPSEDTYCQSGVGDHLGLAIRFLKKKKGYPPLVIVMCVRWELLWQHLGS